MRPKLHLCAGLLVAACGFDSGPPDTPLTTTLGGGDATTSGTTESATSTDESGATSDETTAATTTDGSPCDDGWWNSDWTRRSRLRFRGGEHDAILVDMPVLVVLTPNRIDQSVVAVDGSDLRFVDVNGTLVFPHEVEHWDPNGTSWVWVRVPAVPYTDDTYSFWMYYGNPTAGSAESPTDVWSAGYRGVWHLAERSGLLPDSVDAAHGDPGNTRDEVSGRIASARRFDGEGDQRILLGPGSAPFFDGWSSFTLSFWLRPDYADDLAWEAESPGRFLHKGGPMRAGRAFRSAADPPDEGRVEVRFELENAQTVERRVVVPRQAWSWVAYAYDGESFRLYLDGVEATSVALPGDKLIAGTDEVVFGDELSPLRGALDEIRFADQARSPAWIEAQYRSMTDALLAYAMPEACP